MDKEYLPSIERAKFERKKTMTTPDDEKREAIDEKMGLESYVGEHKEQIEALDEKDKLDDDMVKPDLDAIEERIDKMCETMPTADDCDREEPLTIERKVNMLSKIFEHAVGDWVTNLLDERGIIDLVGLDRRGVLYLVQYKENIVRWEAEDCLTKDPSQQAYKDPSVKDPNIKTDIPLSQEAALAEKKKWERKYTGQHRVG